jgi:hypothetical protein
MYQFAPNLTCLCLETRKRFLKGQNSESVLSWSPGGGGFCSSETKHDTITAARPNLFQQGDYRTKVKTPKIGSELRVRAKIVSVAR